MRLIFMGTPDFALPSLRMLHTEGHEIAAVVTAPDRKRGRGQKLTGTPVKQYAEEHGIPVLQPASLADTEFQHRLASFDAECFVVVAFRILPKEVFTIPPRGSFNLHASLLPKFRGAAPINWALMRGERETGVTTFFLKEKVDTGSVILQERIPIGENMTAGELHDELADLGAEAVLRSVEMIADGSVDPQPQDDALATPAPKIFRDTCMIDFSKSARQVHDQIRGLSPYPAAWTMHAGLQLKVYESRVLSEEGSGMPGEVLESGRRLCVQCGTGSIRLMEVKAEGRRLMTAEEFLRGYRLPVGAVLHGDAGTGGK